MWDILSAYCFLFFFLGRVSDITSTVHDDDDDGYFLSYENNIRTMLKL